MKLYRQFLSFSKGRQIALFVCALHLLAVLGLVCHHAMTQRMGPPKPILVKTHQLPRPAPAASIVAHAPVKSVVAQAPAAIAATKQTPAAPAAIAATKQTTAAPAAVKASPKPIAKPALIKPAKQQASLTKEEPTHAVQHAMAELSIPSRHTPVQRTVDATPEAASGPTYGEFLISYLQNSLDLPEYGEVRAKLEIDRFGHLIDCEILEAKSEKNAAFLKNQLPNLAFPCLNDFDILDTSQTFTITFRNVEIR